MLEINNCTFLKNSAPLNAGGALYISQTMAPRVPIGVVVKNSKFIGN